MVVSFLNVPFLLSASFCPGSVRRVCGWASGPHPVDSNSSLLASELVRGLRREPMRLSIAVPGNCQEILTRVLAKPGRASAKALIVGRSCQIKRFEGFKPIQRESRIVVDCIQSACCVNKHLPPHPAPLIARRTDAKVPETARSMDETCWICCWGTQMPSRLTMFITTMSMPSSRPVETHLQRKDL